MSFLCRIVVLGCLLAAAGVNFRAVAAGLPAGIDAVRAMAKAGAVQLALQRIDDFQSADARDPDWSDLEILRLQLLGRLGRHEEALRRIAALPVHSPTAVQAVLHAAAARAALAAGNAALAREHAGRALWAPGASAAAMRELRLLVIRSQVVESRIGDAWRSMLRFEQDYRPLDAATATAFVDTLLDAGMTREAVTWLPLLDGRGAVLLRLRMHAGLVTNGDALVQARAAIVRSNEPAWWRLLLDAATRSGDGAARLAALEQLFERDSQPQTATGLWAAYLGHARAAANAHQLLAGDDASWLGFAIRRAAGDAPEARAYLAHVARHAADPVLRQRALDQLAADYAAAGLPRVAIGMFDAWPGRVDQLSDQTRRVLGGMAGDIGDHRRALLYLQGVPAADAMPSTVWQLRLCALALRAGHRDAAAEAVRRLAAETFPIPQSQLPEWLLVAGQLADHGLYDAALALSGRILPHAGTAQSGGVLSAMARAYAGRNQPRLAADFHLRAAMQAPGDVAAAEARLQAGLSLMRAGLVEDARVQFEWLLKNAADPAQIAIARRELGF